jgi:hypothetical protein
MHIWYQKNKFIGEIKIKMSKNEVILKGLISIAKNAPKKRIKKC